MHAHAGVSHKCCIRCCDDSASFSEVVSFSDFVSSTVPAMKAMKAMKASGAMTASAAFGIVAKQTSLKSKDVKVVVTSYMGLAVSKLKKNCAFKFGSCLNLKLKKQLATPARKGVNLFTKEPCVFKAKPASKTVRALAMKLNEIGN